VTRPGSRLLRVAVAGGTGLVGRLVVAELTRRGVATVVLSRARGVDLLTADGLAHHLTGVDAVIDATDIGTLRRAVSVGFFGTVTRNLLTAGAQAGVRHHVALSVVGADRVPSGYYAGKREQERLVRADPAGSVLRAAQFFEFADRLLGRDRAPIPAVVPIMRCRPVAVAEVARVLTTHALGPVPGSVVELAGPQEQEMSDLVRRLARAIGARRPVLGIRPPGATGRAMATGGLLPHAGGLRGTQTFDEWLAVRTARPDPVVVGPR
jgi:uncharacterized protein YbjT (DUF2867 family)